MSANFKPVLNGYSGQGAFRFWCQKVIPLVYDDSLSYYELLNKVVQYLNNTIADVAVVEDNVQRIADAYGELEDWTNEKIDELETFINEYFDNLDVQEEINTKLDEMASDGSLTTLLAPFIPDLVTDWLTEHITPTSPIIDSSLTISGAGADAKVVGDNFKRAILNRDALTVDNVPSEYSALSDITESGMLIVTVGASVLLTDSPFYNIGYYLITGKTVALTDNEINFQLAFPYTGDVTRSAFRTYNTASNVWNEWVYNIDSGLIIKDIGLSITTDNVADYPNLESFENGSMIAVTQGASALLTDSPFYNVGFYVMTGTIHGSNSTEMFFQFAIPYTDNTPYSIAIRTYNLSNSTYNNWIKYEKAIQPNDDSSVSRTVEIRTRLENTKYVKLPKGNFYINSVMTMPENCTLEGSGKETKLIVAKDTTGLRMGAGSRITNLSVVGAGEDITLDLENISANHTGISHAGSTIKQGMVDHCWISNFEGNGIYLSGQGTPVDKGCLISDCFITNCNRGIYVRQNSEYNKIVNCVVALNGYGILSRGGNNNVTNCGFDANYIGVQIDADMGDNTGHGLFSACTINHSGNPINTGYGVIVRDSGRMLFNGCNIYHSKIRLQNTNGNIFNGCGFGTTNFEILQSGCNIIADCICRNNDGTIYIASDTTQTKIHDVYYRNGQNMATGVLTE